MKCDICRRHAALIGDGELHPLFTRTGPGKQGQAPRVYRKDICDDCVALFNSRHWKATRKTLAQSAMAKLIGKW